MDGRTVWPAAILVVAGLLSLDVAAATLQVEPVSIRLTPEKRAAVLRLRNKGAEPLDFQVRVFHWRQQDGEDRLGPTDALKVSPPINAIPAGGEQVVRILLAEEVEPAGEETFRLIVDELPPATPESGTVRMLIRYSIPVTVRPVGLEPAVLSFRLAADGGRAVLEARNDGGRSVRLSRVSLTTRAGEHIEVNPGLFGYVLARSVRRWVLGLDDNIAIEQIAGITADAGGQPTSYSLDVLR